MTPAERRKQEEARRRSIQPGRFNSNGSTDIVVEAFVNVAIASNNCDSSNSYDSPPSCDSSSFGD